MRLMTLVVAAGLLWPPSAFAQFWDGNELYEDCTAQSATDWGVCHGYVIGLADARIIDGTICVPNGVEVRQVVDIVVQYLREHPESRHIAAERLAEGALKRAFPCK
jgi:hypothetical protein